METLLIDDALPEFDTTLAVHAIVDAPSQKAFDAARTLDLLEVQTPLLTASFWVRDLPAKVLRKSVPPPEKLTLAGESGLPGWVMLGEHSDHEIAFGAVGVFWTPTIKWNEHVDSSNFAAFSEPGWGKIACNFTTIPYGAQRTLLTYECRVLATDDDSRRRFLRYWRLIRPFVHHIMRATVTTITQHAERTAQETSNMTDSESTPSSETCDG